MGGADAIRFRPIRRAAYASLSRSYASWRFYQAARVRWKWRWLRSVNPVLVYQMGKVASRSVEQALQDAPIDRPVVHVHYLAPDAIRAHQRVAGELFQRSLDETGRPGPQWRTLAHAQARMILEHVGRMRRRGPLPIVTLVREPVSQQLSEFFHNLDRRAPGLVDVVRERPTAPSTIETAMRRFAEELSDYEPLRWFDDELREVFDVDVFASDFDVDAGYEVIEDDGVELLVLRFEDLDDAFEPAMAEFLGVEGVVLPRRNTGDGKYYSATYDLVKRSLTLADDELERIYGARRVRHFYSDEELASFRRRWATGG